MCSPGLGISGHMFITLYDSFNQPLNRLVKYHMSQFKTMSMYSFTEKETNNFICSLSVNINQQ